MNRENLIEDINNKSNHDQHPRRILVQIIFSHQLRSVSQRKKPFDDYDYVAIEDKVKDLNQCLIEILELLRVTNPIMEAKTK